MAKHSSSHRKKASKQYTITGINPIATLLDNSPEKVLNVFLSDNQSSSQRLQQTLTSLKRHGIPFQYIASETFKERYSGVTQGIAAEVLIPKARTAEALKDWLKQELPEQSLLLILDQIQDPHNLGAILRTADAAGVDAVITSDKNSAPLNATVSKVASGAAESVPLFRVANLNRAIEHIKEAGIWLVGTTDHAQQTLYDTNLSGHLALVLGSEGSGMRRLTEEACDYLVKLPMAGVVNSLNVSVATGICLYEINRQRAHK
ncbi:MAG: 23S rRNA (guanosine(2251)-2'-O)-methyltransferase RlmB [Arenicella sp.]